MTLDPLLQYEESLHVEKPRVSHTSRVLRGIKFLSMYLVLTGVIFTLLMGILNFSAYSARLTNWIDPEIITNMRDQLQTAVGSSNVTVHAAAAMETTRESLDVVKEKIALTDPDVIYSRSYDANTLLGGIAPNSLDATFDVAPYENRIIIPRLGKNIPLVDVDHDSDASYSQMHEIFMNELQKGVVRYPGTAKPGEIGNVFIFWHSSNYPWIKSDYNDVFALLDTLEKKDEIIVYYNQQKFVYRVTDRATVKPGDTKVLSSRDQSKKELSLMTCWPVGTTLERYLIFAELVENN